MKIISNKVIFYVAMIISIVSIFALSPITQSQLYHNFAEQRIFLNIPHFGDVISNLSFVIVGLLLLYQSKKWQATEIYKGQYKLFKILAYGSILLGLGSGYYHWAPVDITLAWDRATMILGFGVIFYDSCIRYDIFTKNKPVIGVILITTLFLGTIPFWLLTSRLEPYVFVQFFTMFILVVFAATNYKKVPSKHLFNMFIWYAVAKLCESQDNVIFELTHQFVSGHTLKHIAYAISLYMFGKDMLNKDIKN